MENGFAACARQMRSALGNGYGRVLALGQKPGTRAVNIEQVACFGYVRLTTDFPYGELTLLLRAGGFSVKISQNAGRYLCNHVYWHGPREIEESRRAGELAASLLFMHVPSLQNLPDPAAHAAVFSGFMGGGKG